MRIDIGILFRGRLKERIYVFDIVAVRTGEVSEMTLGTIVTKSNQDGSCSIMKSLRSGILEQINVKEEDMESLYKEAAKEAKQLAEFLEE